MKLTKHAQVRIKQRGISDIELLLISIFGVVDAKNRMTLPERTQKKIIQALDKCNKMLVVDDEVSALITAYAISR
ncbi:MAG: hypothetical protein FWG17_05075 [Desulfovibrionaceae bacterium]|nr:hypothetical protein [Desulfovibrionaceae bacterium]